MLLEVLDALEAAGLVCRLEVGGALRARFDRAAAEELPGQVREALADLPAPVARAGRGAWTGARADAGAGIRTGADTEVGADASAGTAATPGCADLFVALPLAAVEGGDPVAMAAIVHLHDDEASRAGAGYRSTWNGVLRLFNLLQFLPGAWWTTRVGARSGLYPEFAPAAEGPAVLGFEAEIEPGPPPGEGWKEAIGLAAPETHALLAKLSARGTPAPEVGFELAGGRGAVIAEAELAWPAHGVAVLLPDRETHAPAFTAAGWQVFESDDEDLDEALASALAGED